MLLLLRQLNDKIRYLRKQSKKSESEQIFYLEHCGYEFCDNG